MELEYQIRRTHIAGIGHIVKGTGTKIRNPRIRHNLPICPDASLHQDNYNIVWARVCRVTGTGIQLH